MLEEPRKKIDDLDQEIVKLLEARMSTVVEIAEIKLANQLAVLDEGREKILLDKISSLVQDEKYQNSILQVYQQILESSKDFQKKVILSKEV